MTFQFGKPAIKSVPGAVSDSVRSIRLNRPPDDPYMKWNDVGEWMDEVEIGLEKLLLWSGIKKAETPAQTLIAESLIGYTGYPAIEDFVNRKLTSQYIAPAPDTKLDNIYQNTLDKSRFFTITVRLSADTSEGVIVYVGSASPPTTDIAKLYHSLDVTGIEELSCSFIVKPGYYYEVATLNGTPTIIYWDEWH
jgi:hypothetical protein